MADDRTSRALESRETEAREKAWTPPETLPNPNPKPGIVFRYIRVSNAGEADPSNASSKFREGWVPVKAQDVPELMHFNQADQSGRYKDNVEIGGLLLCQIRKEAMDQRAAYYARMTQSQMEAVENSFMKVNDERMPLFRERKTATSFGRGN